MKEFNLGLVPLSNSKIASVGIQRDVLSFCKYHKHRFVEIAYFYHGTGIHQIEDDVYDIKSGDIFVLNGDVFHQFKGEDLRVINVMFLADFISPEYKNETFLNQFCEKHFGKEVADKLSVNKYVYLPNFSYKCSDKIVYDMFQEFNMQADCFCTILRNEIEVLVIQLLRSLLSEGNNTSPIFLHKSVLEKAISLIDEHAEEINKVEDITDKIGYNKLYFNRLFKDYVGVSISKYVRKKKMEKAANFLMHTNYTIEKIAEMVGYVDMKSFYSAFKKEMNMSPGVYRSKLLGETKK